MPKSVEDSGGARKSSGLKGAVVDEVGMIPRGRALARAVFCNAPAANHSSFSPDAMSAPPDEEGTIQPGSSESEDEADRRRGWVRQDKREGRLVPKCARPLCGGQPSTTSDAILPSRREVHLRARGQTWKKDARWFIGWSTTGTLGEP